MDRLDGLHFWDSKVRQACRALAPYTGYITSDEEYKVRCKL